MATADQDWLKQFMDILTQGRWSHGHWIPGGTMGDAGAALADIFAQAGGVESEAAKGWGSAALAAAQELGSAYMNAAMTQIGYLGKGIGVIGETTAAANNIVKMATERAVAMQDIGTQQAIRAMGDAHTLAQTNLLPYSSAGQWALSQYKGLLSGEKDFRTDPGYEFRMGEGAKAIERMAAAKGRMQGPSAKTMASYSQGLASDEFNRVAGRYSSLAQMGAPAAERSALMAAGTGQGIAGAHMTSAGRKGSYVMGGGAKQADIIQKGGMAQAGLMGEQGKAAFAGITGAGQSLYGGAMNKAMGDFWSQSFLANAMRDSGSILFDTIMKGWDIETMFSAMNESKGNWWDQWGGDLFGGLLGFGGDILGGILKGKK